MGFWFLVFQTISCHFAISYGLSGSVWGIPLCIFLNCFQSAGIPFGSHPLLLLYLAVSCCLVISNPCHLKSWTFCKPSAHDPLIRCQLSLSSCWGMYDPAKSMCKTPVFPSLVRVAKYSNFPYILRIILRNLSKLVLYFDEIPVNVRNRNFAFFFACHVTPVINLWYALLSALVTSAAFRHMDIFQSPAILMDRRGAPAGRCTQKSS
jgi:hypothetical protein